MMTPYWTSTVTTILIITMTVTSNGQDIQRPSDQINEKTADYQSIKDKAKRSTSIVAPMTYFDEESSLPVSANNNNYPSPSPPMLSEHQFADEQQSVTTIEQPNNGCGTSTHLATNCLRHPMSSELYLVKRAPFGFQGMRGKKDFEITELDKRNIMRNQSARGKKILINYLYRVIPKRAPSGFMGMRGKKLHFNDFESDKRAPSGFLGMRGKKDNGNEDNSAEIDDSTNMHPDNAAIEFTDDIFRELQNEHDLLSELLKFYDWKYLGDIEKRQPNGFLGMRGKKISEETASWTNNWAERVPLNELVETREKRWTSANEDVNFDENEPRQRERVSFQGVQSKNNVANAPMFQNKRAPFVGFFGMRGKKEGLNFFGMRGKKMPIEFRGKFVGVRGKKMSDSVPIEQMTIKESDTEMNKRVPNGFLGMRGKKWSATNK